MTIAKIKDRIKALLAKGADASCTAAEREAFTAKAHELLNQHQIDLGELIDSEDPVDVTRGDTLAFLRSWDISLRCAVAKYYGCRSVIVNGFGQRTDGSVGPTVRIDFVGRESARATAELMFPFIREQVMAAGRELFKQDTAKTLVQHQRAVGNALILRIHALIPKAEAMAPAAGPNALVPVDRIEEVMALAFPNMTTGRKSKIGTNGKAVDAAAGVSLHKQASGSSALRLA